MSMLYNYVNLEGKCKIASSFKDLITSDNTGHFDASKFEHIIKEKYSGTCNIVEECK
jgi:hypothetical protein